MDDLQLRSLVFDYAMACEKDERGFWPTPEEAVAKKSAALRAAYYATELHMRVFNGGLSQYFFVHSLLTVGETVAALRFIGAADHLRVFERAFENVRAVNDLVAADVDSSEYVPVESPVDEHIERDFAEIEPELGELVSAFIRSHPELYKDAFPPNGA